MFNDLRCELIVRFVDIGGIVNRHCLKTSLNCSEACKIRVDGCSINFTETSFFFFNYGLKCIYFSNV